MLHRHQLFIAALSLASLLTNAACVNQVDSGSLVLDDVNDAAEGRAQGIINGGLPSAWYHHAVVALHQRYGSNVSVSSFCTGTLITPTVVLTAAHCLEGESASALAIYVGDNPTIDPSPTFIHVTELKIHPSYNPVSNLHDIALVRLASPAQGITPVPALPAALALTSADAGLGLEFVGFGITENGSSDQKLVASGALATLGCGVSGCPSGLTSQTAKSAMFAYVQPNEGPCNGDSGGPAFVVRDGAVYVGGMTSFGDAQCRHYGVSARADTYEDLINAFIGTGGTTTSSPPDASEAPDATAPTGEGYAFASPPLTAERGYYHPFVLDVPAGEGAITVMIGGGSGDADLYVKKGGGLSLDSYHCRPFLEGNGESCSFDDDEGGTYEIWVHAYQTYRDVTLQISR